MKHSRPSRDTGGALTGSMPAGGRGRVLSTEPVLGFNPTFRLVRRSRRHTKAVVQRDFAIVASMPPELLLIDLTRGFDDPVVY